MKADKRCGTCEWWRDDMCYAVSLFEDRQITNFETNDDGCCRFWSATDASQQNDFSAYTTWSPDRTCTQIDTAPELYSLSHEQPCALTGDVCTPVEGPSFSCLPR